MSLTTSALENLQKSPSPTGQEISGALRHDFENGGEITLPELIDLVAKRRNLGPEERLQIITTAANLAAQLWRTKEQHTTMVVLENFIAYLNTHTARPAA
jgi:hypothetical protein